MSERLQKVIAEAGITSRRKAEKLITEGHVKVNGQKVTELGVKVSGKDEVTVDEIPIAKEEPVYFLLYKPRGVVSTVSDEKNRKTVLDFFKDIPQRIYPIGRLDYDTSGVLLLTNDGDLDNRLTHPKYEVEKTYIAKVEGLISEKELNDLARGVVIDQRKTSDARAKLIKQDRRRGTSVVSLTIHEGRNHQVKKMLEKVGHPVMKLSREQYGFLDLKGLKPGEFRELNPHEVERLKDLTNEK